MRIVADTHTVVSGLLWMGPPRLILDRARAGQIELYTTIDLLAELENVLGRPKLARRLEQVGISAHELVMGYAALATVVQPALISPTVEADPDDDAVLACAAAASAQAIVSGDRHLLDLGTFADIPILRPADVMVRHPL